MFRELFASAYYWIRYLGESAYLIDESSKTKKARKFRVRTQDNHLHYLELDAYYLTTKSPRYSC
jgi:hypothetical protein